MRAHDDAVPVRAPACALFADSCAAGGVCAVKCVSFIGDPPDGHHACFQPTVLDWRPGQETHAVYDIQTGTPPSPAPATAQEWACTSATCTADFPN